MPTSIDTFLDIGTIPRTPFETSSTSIRKALAGGASSEYLVGLPYSAFVDIKAHGLYTSSAGTGQPWLPTPGSILIPLLSPDFG